MVKNHGVHQSLFTPCLARALQHFYKISSKAFTIFTNAVENKQTSGQTPKHIGMKVNIPMILQQILRLRAL